MTTGTEVLESVTEGGRSLDREGEARRRVVVQLDHAELSA